MYSFVTCSSVTQQLETPGFGVSFYRKPIYRSPATAAIQT